MIFNISDSQFKHIMSNQKFHLPIRWDGKDFKNSLNCLYDDYLSELESCYNKNKDNALSLELEKFNTDLKEMTFICNRLLYCIKRYSGNLKWDNESKDMRFWDINNLPVNQNDPDLIDIYIRKLKK